MKRPFHVEHAERTDWQESGDAPMTRQQQKMLNAACGDLSEQLDWHGHRLSKDDWRHLLSGVVLGERMVPGINTGDGPPGMIRLARSSLDLSKSNATKAIRMAFEVGDYPQDQGLRARPVRWCEVIVKARWFVDDEAVAA